MTGPEVRVFPLDRNGYVRAEACPVRGLHLTWEGCEDIVAIGPHAVPLGLVRALGPQFAELAIWCADHGVSVATDVREDVERQAQLIRLAEARGFKDYGEDW